MGKSQPAEGCSNREARQTNDVSIGSSQDRSGSTGEVGEGQAGEESGLKQRKAVRFLNKTIRLHSGTLPVILLGRRILFSLTALSNARRNTLLTAIFFVKAHLR